ncbi:hypothetical protein Y032_0540g3156 [Ancylostoma ceylanicum]|uniref:Uncharacterized protein n=1 Tax=Ancylostoma ceylanicum TaxID=53326 RepID=A0A016WT37_9BILA|nr:hypothetical protein Y032_0540g3156 [Ancylostoma ceylanicum]
MVTEGCRKARGNPVMEKNDSITVGTSAFTTWFVAHYSYTLQTAVEKGRDRDAAFSGRDTGALHARPGCLLWRRT